MNSAVQTIDYLANPQICKKNSWVILTFINNYVENIVRDQLLLHAVRIEMKNLKV